MGTADRGSADGAISAEPQSSPVDGLNAAGTSAAATHLAELPNFSSWRLEDLGSVCVGQPD
jgi:hypothetical protein